MTNHRLFYAQQINILQLIIWYRSIIFSPWNLFLGKAPTPLPCCASAPSGHEMENEGFPKTVCPDRMLLR